MRDCKDNGFPHPLTIDISMQKKLDKDETLADVEELRTFPNPGLLNPNLTSGGRGMTLVNIY